MAKQDELFNWLDCKDCGYKIHPEACSNFRKKGWQKADDNENGCGRDKE